MLYSLELPASLSLTPRFTDFFTDFEKKLNVLQSITFKQEQVSVLGSEYVLGLSQSSF